MLFLITLDYYLHINSAVLFNFYKSMSPLSLFIIFLISITFLIARYALNRVKEPIQSIGSKKTKERQRADYWINAEVMNGRLAMMGFLALVINYGLFGWVIPGFF